MKCGTCGTESPGPFCAGCGRRLDSVGCRACGEALLPGARFCTQCGEAVGGRKAGGEPRLAWLVAGAAVLFVAGAAAIAAFRGPDAGETWGGMPPAAAPAGARTVAGSPPPLTGTPREQADRLFNRIMQERQAGNMERAEFFLPMALAAYRQASPLDDDGLYHVSLLQTLSGDGAGARATAERILETSPDHLLALASAAAAAEAAGDEAAAGSYYERLLAAYDAEQARDRVEYRDHASMLPLYRDRARAYLGR